jgi:hypothetical protein
LAAAARMTVVLLGTMMVSVVGLSMAFSSVYTLEMGWQKMVGTTLEHAHEALSGFRG